MFEGCYKFSFFLSAVLIGLVVPSTIAAISDNGKEESSANVLLDGVRFIVRSKLLLSLIATSMIANLLDSALFSVAMPVYAERIWGSVLPIGLLSATFGGCAFVSTLLFGAFGHRLPRRMTFALCFMAISVRFWALAFSFPLPWLFGVYAFNGLAVGPINPIGTTVEQEMVPVVMRARVFGALTAGYLAGMPLGGLIGGYLINWIGLLPALFAMGACYLLVTSSLLINPALKAMQKPSVVESE
jgi:MFS family permease